jgi:hypothetical protein
MFVNSDFTELLKRFRDNNVRYLIIGGYAFIQYAEPRYTKDLDLWISTKRASGRPQDLIDAATLEQTDDL